jgi:GT2 family glycosyltransferase
LGAARLEHTLESLDAASAFAEAELEVVVAWEGAAEPGPDTGRVRYLDVFPGGLGNARNRGLAATSGTYVAFVDDDEVVDEGWAKGMLAAFERAPFPDAVFGAVVAADKRGTAPCHFDGSDDRVFTGTRTPPWHVGTGGNMAFRRDTIVGIGGFDPTFGSNAEAMSADESELMLRLLRAGSTLVWTPDMRVYHPTKADHERVASRRTYGFGMGRAVRRQRTAFVAATYVAETARVAARALAQRNRRRLREAKIQLGAFAAGVARSQTWLSPRSALALAPPEVRSLIVDVEIVPLPAPDRPRPHLLYAVGDKWILHAYGSPLPGLQRAFEDRAKIRAEVPGIPQTAALAAGRDSLWVLEERLPGRHPSPRGAATWFDRVCAWAVTLAGARGRPLRVLDGAEAALALAPPELRPELVEAQRIVAELPAVRVHGDLSRKNVLIDDGGRVGAVDWEECALEGLPGRDILFLAVGAADDRPDADVIRRVARGENPRFGDVLGPLAQLGVARDALRALVLTVAAQWAADEQGRTSELGATSRQRPYLELLSALSRS